MNYFQFRALISRQRTALIDRGPLCLLHLYAGYNVKLVFFYILPILLMKKSIVGFCHSTYNVLELENKVSVQT